MSVRRKLERLALSSADTAHCPDEEVLAAYILHQLKGNDELRIAAHVRGCVICSYDVARLRPERRRIIVERPSLERLLPIFRDEGFSDEPGYRYDAEEITIDLLFNQERGRFWRLTGRVRRREAPLEAAQVMLRAKSPQEDRAEGQPTDSNGGFTFFHVREGQYTLSMVSDDVEIIIRHVAIGAGSA